MSRATEHPRTTSVDGPLTPIRAAAAVRAFATHPARGYPYPVPAAAALTVEHRLRPEAHRVVGEYRADDLMVAAAARPDRSCAALVDRIDPYAFTEHIEGHTDMLHTESLGQLIDRVAATWMRGGHRADAHVTPTEPTVRIVASPRLSALSRGYDALATDLLRGRGRPPAMQKPTGSNGTI